MNLYESVKNNSKKYNLVHADSDKISELEKGSAFTFEGLSTDDKNLSQMVDFIEKETKGFKIPCTIYTWKGKEFNDKYDLTGNNRYPDDLNFVSLSLDSWSEMGNLPIFKFQIGARWLDDIVDNNARREGREGLDEAEDGKIRVTLYGDIKTFDSREEALEYFEEAMSYCDPMSSEFRTYLKCYTQIKEGKTEILDEADNRVSEIDLHRTSIDGDYDTHFADKLEDLGYEYILNYDGKVFYRRDPQHFDDDIIIIDYEHGSMTKVDHNGESLFFNDDEFEKLNQEEVE